MVRPRLVEEGEPLGDWISSDDDDNDSNNGDTMETETNHHSPDTSRRSTTAAAASSTAAALSSDAEPPTSSLLRALGGKIPTRFTKKKPNLSMRFEIGQDSSSMYHERMEYESHSSSVATTSRPIPPDDASRPRPPHHTVTAPSSPPRRPHSRTSVTRTRVEIGADERPAERMMGVEVAPSTLPLLVADGANVAYAYAQARQEHFHGTGRIEPDVRGLAVTCSYFSSIRVRIVLPASFMRSRPRAGDPSHVTNAHMETDQADILQQLQGQGKLVAAPPRDDDDAYCLTIAQRENIRARQTRRPPAFVLSNDMFRDAQGRDASGQLREWLENGDCPETGPGRISYTFVDLDCKDDYGDPIFDLVPNPRHPLIIWIEELRRQQGSV